MRGKRKDAVQGAVVKAIRKLGGEVIYELDDKGRPDILAGFPGLTLTGAFDREKVTEMLAAVPGVVVHEGAHVLIEVKSPGGALTPYQKMWWGQEWWGPRYIVKGHNKSVARQIVALIMGIKK
jgi:hypothetical protein